jgi:hypothetical protein
VLYYGTQRLYKTTNGADNWVPISDDLSGNPDPSSLRYGTITTIAVSPVDPAYLYVGTDDAHVWVTDNGGDTWIDISNGLPDRWVTRVTADSEDLRTAYVTLSGYRLDEYQPHVFKTTNAGESWIDISGDLPEIPANDIVVYPTDPPLLFVATDAGVYVCTDSQWAWSLVGRGLPNSAVHDLELVVETNELIAGTHGRSMFRIDVTELGADKPVRPDATSLTLNAFPNPASARDRLVTISYQLPESDLRRSEDSAILRIVDLSGRQLRSLTPDQLATGETPGLFQWDRTTRTGAHAPPGTYILRLELGPRVLCQPLVLLQ